MAEAVHHDRLVPGRVYIAPAGRHLVVQRRGLEVLAQTVESAPVNGHRPSVDVLMHSAAQVWGASAVGIVLTGMGNDGAEGLLAMRRAGAMTAIQLPDTCAVFGMPKQALAVGATELALDVDGLAQLIVRETRPLASGGAPRSASG